MSAEKQVLRSVQDDCAHLERLGSKPRPVGSAANHEARQYCAEQLRSLGFTIAERPFQFSALPGRYAAQIIGAIAVVGSVAAYFAFAAWYAQFTMLVIIVVAWALGTPWATMEPWFRETGVNLEATRGAAPKVWLVAHVDSKSQGISSALRTLGVLVLVLSLSGALAFPTMRSPTGLLGTLGGLILCFAFVGDKSDGAADNASGVAAVLEAAALIPRDRAFGVLITDAEELALAGAHAWVRGRPKAIAINCDTIDDRGRLVIFQYGAFSHELDASAGPAARDVDPRAKVMRPPWGVLTDSNAFHKAGWKTLTLARGTIRTLNRIHTRRDSLENLRGTGIPDAARVLARIVEELA